MRLRATLALPLLLTLAMPALAQPPDEIICHDIRDRSCGLNAEATSRYGPGSEALLYRQPSTRPRVRASTDSHTR